jgi:hypothetical protein
MSLSTYLNRIGCVVAESMVSSSWMSGFSPRVVCVGCCGESDNLRLIPLSLWVDLSVLSVCQHVIFSICCWDFRPLGLVTNLTPLLLLLLLQQHLFECGRDELMGGVIHSDRKYVFSKYNLLNKILY